MLRKYQSVEKAEVVSPEDHQAIENALHKVGKTSLVDLDEEQRREITDKLSEND